MTRNTLAALKKASAQNFTRINKELENMTKSARPQDDPRFWQPTVDKHGNGYAVIRFLPATAGEDTPVVRYYSHGFQGPGGWYIENSLTSLGKDDPVSEYNTKLWNTGLESNKAIARKQKRNCIYVSNILVVQDKENPQNEGEVFLYKHGPKIFEKIKTAAAPTFEDETPINPYDFWGGANFKLKIRKVEGYRNYDASEFSETTPVAGSDAAIQAIWDKQHSLSEFTDPAQYKSYDELKVRLYKVLQLTTSAPAATAPSAGPVSEINPPLASGAVEGDFVVADSTEDDTASFFASIAEDN